MAESLCGPSNPTKGLVGHLDHDRTIQQDRVVGSSATVGPSFRSATQEIPTADSGEAAFGAFTSASAGAPHDPNALASRNAHVSGQALDPNHNPFLYKQLSCYQPDPSSTWDKLDRENHVNQPFPARHGGLDHHRPSAGLVANTDWVNDFHREKLLGNELAALRLQSGNLRETSKVRGGTRADRFNASVPARDGRHFASGHPMVQGNLAPYGPGPMMAASASVPVHVGFAAQGGQHFLHGNVAAAPYGPSRMMPANGPGLAQARQTGLPFHHYPQSLGLAANTEEALDAAFAAYDQDFESEMDQWVATHGPEDRRDHHAIMTQHADALDNLRQTRHPKVMSQRDPSTRHSLKAQEDHELSKYASIILSTMVQSDNEKFRGSSFADLMRRIVNREVVVEGDNLIDVATGEPTDLSPRDLVSQPIIQVPPMPQTFIPPPDAELRAKRKAELDEKEELEEKEPKEKEAASAEISGPV